MQHVNGQVNCLLPTKLGVIANTRTEGPTSSATSLSTSGAGILKNDILKPRIVASFRDCRCCSLVIVPTWQRQEV